MNNPRFVNEEEILLVQDEDYVNYTTPNTRWVDEASFMEPNTTEAKSTLGLNQEVRRDKLAALYRHLNVTGNLDLIEYKRFRLENTEKGTTNLEFYNSDRWFPLTKRTGKFFAPKT